LSQKGQKYHKARKGQSAELFLIGKIELKKFYKMQPEAKKQGPGSNQKGWCGCQLRYKEL
jgi:hypothetical protein